MIKLLRRLLRFLESARLAVSLLLFVAAWSILATLVPQTGSASAGAGGWLTSQPVLAHALAFVGLDHAFGAPLFLVAVAVLAVSTGLCAWRRTRVAIGRMRLLDAARGRDAGSVAEGHDFEVACDSPGLDTDGALRVAQRTLAALGVGTKRRGDVLASVSTPISVWGSPVFHWGLVAIILVILVGSLQRSEGLMGVPVGRSLPNAPDSYGVLHAGPLHVWADSPDVIRVDAFEKDYLAGGIDRGPTPKVSLLDSKGQVLKSQYIYPNSPLQFGSLTIHPSEWGFAVDVSLLDASGTAVSSATRLVDLSQEASEGTVPLGDLALNGGGGTAPARIAITVPLIRQGTQSLVPAAPSAHIAVTGTDGHRIADEILAPGETLTLPSGLALRVESVGFYARLSVVEDGTIPFLYAATALAMLGLTLTVISRQQAVLVTARGVDGAVRVFVSAQLWRNAPTNKEEIRSELTAALRGDEEDMS